MTLKRVFKGMTNGTEVIQDNFTEIEKQLTNIKSSSTDTASHARTADRATNADNATRADRATTATTADRARQADVATNATSAVTAETAKNAKNAEFAERARVVANADYAKKADDANYARTAYKATEADHATTATTATEVKVRDSGWVDISHKLQHGVQGTLRYRRIGNVVHVLANRIRNVWYGNKELENDNWVIAKLPYSNDLPWEGTTDKMMKYTHIYQGAVAEINVNAKDLRTGWWADAGNNAYAVFDAQAMYITADAW